MHILLISGQGNSLQSATALSTACYAASTGVRTLLASVGPTHILGAMLGQALSSRPLELEPNLAAMEMSAREEIGQRWENARENLRTGLVRRMADITSDELPSFPGMDVLAAMMVVERAARSQRFDLVVFDGPGTESLLRALSVADSVRWMVRIFFGIDRGPGRSRSSQEMAMIPMTLISPNSVAPLQDFRVVLEGHRGRFDALNNTRVRLALPVEDMALPQVRQELGGLGLYGLEVDTLILRGNDHSLDDAAREHFTAGSSTPRPSILVHELSVHPTDRIGWVERGTKLYGSRPEGLSLPRGNDKSFGSPPDQREVRLHIPFLDSRDLDIALTNEEVVVRVGNFRRHILLAGLGDGGRLRARVEGEVLRLWVE